jgi:hypothetical protein
MKREVTILLVGLLLGAAGMFLFTGGTAKVAADCPGEPGKACGNGDVNGSGGIDIADTVYLLAYLFANGPAPVAFAGGGLPATGQTQCYDEDGGVLNCAFIPWDYVGQDGVYQSGCPTANRFVDNGDGTVTDNCTGLMWQRETSDVYADGTIDHKDVVGWLGALKHCEALELAGHTDWRLPNLRELQSIVDYGRCLPSIDPVFGAVSGWYYWSSSTYVPLPSFAWIVYVDDGIVYYDNKINGGYVRAVRG